MIGATLFEPLDATDYAVFWIGVVAWIVILFAHYGQESWIHRDRKKKK